MTTKLDGLFLDTGRLVMGSLTERADTDYYGKPIPEDKRALFFGVAVPKNSPNVQNLINSLWQMAATDYASAPLVMQQINQGLQAKDFAWKIQDGDVATHDRKTGKLRDIPDYMKGCWIFKFSTLYAFDACDAAGNQIGLADIKRGDYVDVMFNSSVNGAVDDTAGIYLNPVAICRVRYGDPIASGVNAASVFAGRQHTLPAGVGYDSPLQGQPQSQGGMPQQQQQPAAGTTSGMPGVDPNGAPAQTQTAPAGGMPGAAGAPPTTVSPHTEILNGPATGGGMPGM